MNKLAVCFSVAAAEKVVVLLLLLCEERGS